MIDTKSKEYIRIYKPDSPTNNCCYICKKHIDGCSWARSLEPVMGWAAKKIEKRIYDTHDGYKIYFCPEFEEGDATEGREYDEDKCLDLVAAVYRSAAEDYKRAYKNKLKAERRGADLFRAEIVAAESTMLQCSFLLGRHTERLKKIVEEEVAEDGEE